MRFLAVDDEPDMLLLIEASVRRWGHEVSTADTLDEALRICTSEPPDVLLLDVTMPEMDGPTFLQRLRADGIEPPRIFLLSAMSPDELDELAASLGVGAISKPFTARGLRAELREVLGDER